MSEIKRHIKEAGVKQTDLAKALGMPDSTLSSILTGKRGLSVRRAMEITHALESLTGRAWSLDELVGKREGAAA